MRRERERIYVGPQPGDRWLLAHPRSGPVAVAAALSLLVLGVSAAAGEARLGAIAAAVSFVGLVAVFGAGVGWTRRRAAAGWTTPKPAWWSSLAGCLYVGWVAARALLERNWILAVLGIGGVAVGVWLALRQRRRLT